MRGGERRGAAGVQRGSLIRQEAGQLVPEGGSGRGGGTSRRARLVKGGATAWKTPWSRPGSTPAGESRPWIHDLDPHPARGSARAPRSDHGVGEGWPVSTETDSGVAAKGE